jgi:hypothetical protein
MDETRDALTRKLQAFKGLGPEDLIMLRELQRQRSLIEAGREVVYEGQYPHTDSRRFPRASQPAAAQFGP